MRVSVSGKQFVFPRICACCGAFPVTKLPVMGREANRNAQTKGWAWDIPYCKACKSHILLSESVLMFSLILVALCGIVGVVIYILGSSLLISSLVTLGAFVSCLLIGFGLLQLVWLRSPPMCQGRFRAIFYVGSRGSCHTFDIRSRRYASEFIRSNRFKLVNASLQVSSILRDAKLGSEQVPRRIFGQKGK